MNEIKVPISADPVTGNPRECVMKRLAFDRKLDAFIEIEIYELNGEGKRLFDVAKELPATTEAERTRRDRAIEKYFPFSPPVPYTTEGSRVNSATGEIVPDGDVTERDFLFGITLNQLMAMTGTTGDDSALGAVFMVVAQKIKAINDQGRN